MVKFKWIVILLIFSQSLQAQEFRMKSFKNVDFSLQYPAAWKIKKDGKQVMFLDSANHGAIIISVFDGVLITEHKLREIVLDTKLKKEEKPDIKLHKTKADITYTYSFTEDKIRTLVKATKKGSRLYLATLTWDAESWPQNEKELQKSFYSFKPALSGNK
jgi:hypothetical protein